jgi:diguanylate cyclase (GGDEF)-like protein
VGSTRAAAQWWAQPWRVFACLGGLVALACLLAPAGPVHEGLFALVSCGAAVAVAVGARLHRPQRVSAWWLLAAGLGTWAAGDVTYWITVDLLGQTSYPGLSDVLYLAAYPVIGAALLRLARQARPGRDREGVVDAAVFAVGFGLLSWTFLVRPVLSGFGADPLAGVVSLVYPAGDLLVLAMLVRVFAAAGHRSAAFGLLASATTVMLLADATYQYTSAYQGYTGGAIDPLWLLASILWGCAALHPSMRRLSDPSPSSRLEFSRARLGALTAAGLLAPGTLALQLVRGDRLDAWAVVICTAVLFLLVVVRMNAMLRRLRAQAVQLTVLARTDPLTRLLNRRSADAELERLRNRALLDSTSLVVALLDLDRFKVYNDTHGHPAGDRLLVGAAENWRIALAGTGLALARWGGEEFAVMAAGVTPERVETLLAELRLVVPHGQTFSAGVAAWDGSEGLDALVARADAALYAAKDAGRDCTRTALAGREPARRPA